MPAAAGVAATTAAAVARPRSSAMWAVAPGRGSGYGPTATLTSGVQSGNGSAVITYNGPLGAVVTLGVSSATTLPGYAETYTASVAAPAGSTTPLGSGTITFNDNGTTLPGCANLSPVSERRPVRSPTALLTAGATRSPPPTPATT